MKIIFFCFCLLLTQATFSQHDTTGNTINGFLTIPPFTINTLPDSSFFSNKQLKKNMPVMMMFFSPDCDHCQQQTKEMIAYKNELKNIQIIMISVLPNKFNKSFYQEYGLNDFKNITLGFDATYKLRQVYQLKTYPAMFVYDKTGTLAKAFIGNIAIAAIIEAVK